MMFDQNRVDAIIHNWKNQVFFNETIHGIPLRHSTSLKPPIGGFRNLASRWDYWNKQLKYTIWLYVRVNLTWCSLHILKAWLICPAARYLWTSTSRLALRNCSHFLELEWNEIIKWSIIIKLLIRYLASRPTDWLFLIFISIEQLALKKFSDFPKME